MTNGVYNPIGKQAEEDVRVRAAVFLMIDRMQVQVGFQLPIRTRYFADKVVVLPCGRFVKTSHIGAKKINAVHRSNKLHFLIALKNNCLIMILL